VSRTLLWPLGPHGARVTSTLSVSSPVFPRARNLARGGQTIGRGYRLGRGWSPIRTLGREVHVLTAARTRLGGPQAQPVWLPIRRQIKRTGGEADWHLVRPLCPNRLRGIIANEWPRSQLKNDECRRMNVERSTKDEARTPAEDRAWQVFASSLRHSSFFRHSSFDIDAPAHHIEKPSEADTNCVEEID